jgi:hypothetical protein
MARETLQPIAADAEAHDVAAWRKRRLDRAGFDEALAGTLAADRRIDLHAALELVDRGCPPRLAARILAPLDSEPKGPG